VARWSGGAEASAYYRGDGSHVVVALAEVGAGAGSTGRLAKRYFGLGVEHILSGIDHLLFVLGLLVLVRRPRPLVKTVTAFTVAHSITLGVAVLGYIPISRGPIEATIALSIVLLAREIVVGARGSTHLVRRRPWLVAFLFGLLHGLGFAGALGAIGLRGGDVPLALLFFNLGVEAGQLAFIAVVLALRPVLARVAGRRFPMARTEPILGYAVGVLATFWFFQRLPAVWGG
jgi:hydrogenase/urease accessory protein HupE